MKRAFRIQEGVDALKQAVRCMPNMGEAHNNLALAYLKMGDLDSARSSLREAMRRGWTPVPELEERILEGR